MNGKKACDLMVTGLLASGSARAGTDARPSVWDRAWEKGFYHIPVSAAREIPGSAARESCLHFSLFFDTMNTETAVCRRLPPPAPTNSETKRLSINERKEVPSMKHRLLSLLLVLVLLCTVLPQARAEDDPAYSGACGESLTWSFDPDTGALTIEGSGEMDDCYGGAPWSGFADQITGVSLPQGLSCIADGAFSECAALAEIEIPDTVTRVGYGAFELCESLGALTIPGSVETIDDWAFNGCTSLADLSLCEGLSSIGSFAFSDCAALTGVTIPETVSSLGWYAFSGCTALTEITVPGGVELLDEGTFEACTGLARVTLCEGVASVEAKAFSGCSALTQLELPETLRYIGSTAFDHCESLTALTIPGGVETVDDGAFQFCSGLRELTICSGVSRIGDSAFQHCTGLRSVRIPGSVKDLDEWAFYHCTGLASLTIEQGVERIGRYAFEHCVSLTHLTIPGSVEEIGDYAFFGCQSLASVTAYYGLGSIGSGAFENCAYLTKVLLPVTVEAIDPSAFQGCEGLTLYGFADSFSQGWAAENEVPFHVLTASDLFIDVRDDAWFAKAVLWAFQYNLTTGTGEGQFSPKQPCTREQIVTFLWKAFGAPEPDGTELPFTDVKPGKYYVDAVRWAYFHDPQITGGISPTSFGVGRPCTRAQVVTFLWNAAGRPEPTGAENPFEDVRETDYFYKPVLWAVENGITSGTSPTTFSPKDSCTRAQVVTFLWKTLGESRTADPTEDPPSL